MHYRRSKQHAGRMSHMNSDADWLEGLIDIWEVMGLNPVRESDFFICPLLVKG